MKAELEAADRRQWRTWLREHHDEATEVWLVYYKKHTERPGIAYTESVEEAICFGWIDGLKKRVDDERYKHRFTPRRPGSKWSPRNIETARRMIAGGRMAPAGLRAFNERERYDAALLEARAEPEPALPPDVEEALRAHAGAWANFNALAPSHRKQYVLWLMSAKKQETRERRLAEAIALLSENKKLGMR